MEATIFLVILGALLIYVSSRRANTKTTNSPAKQSHGSIDPTGHFYFEIVGEFAYQDALLQIWNNNKNGSDTLERTATLFLENDNPHDDKAVRVDIDGLTVGYFSRDDARTYRKQLKTQKIEGLTLTCIAQLEGGGPNADEGDIEVTLDLPLQQ